LGEGGGSLSPRPHVPTRVSSRLYLTSSPSLYLPNHPLDQILLNVRVCAVDSAPGRGSDPRKVQRSQGLLCRADSRYVPLDLSANNATMQIATMGGNASGRGGQVPAKSPHLLEGMRSLFPPSSSLDPPLPPPPSLFLMYLYHPIQTPPPPPPVGTSSCQPPPPSPPRPTCRYTSLLPLPLSPHPVSPSLPNPLLPCSLLAYHLYTTHPPSPPPPSPPPRAPPLTSARTCPPLGSRTLCSTSQRARPRPRCGEQKGGREKETKKLTPDLLLNVYYLLYKTRGGGQATPSLR
jgi:hypothetical protein